jgi:nucleotide-binding universal stress UspA family protein
MAFRTVLVPLDGSPLSEQALPAAVAVAERSGARLVLLEVAVASIATRVDQASGQPRTVDLAAQYLAAIADRLRGQAEVDSVERHGEPGDEIVAESRRQGADLIVMSTHGRSGLGRWLYGSVADHVLGHASIPILLVPAVTDHTWPGAGERALRILVAVDGSDASRPVAEAAGELAAGRGAELLLLGVTTSGASGSPGRGDEPPAGEDRNDRRRTFLEGIAEPLRQRGLQVDVLVASGRAGATIEAVAAERGMDVIALARHGGRGPLGRALGGVAGDVVRRARQPLLLVSPGLATS